MAYMWSSIRRQYLSLFNGELNAGRDKLVQTLEWLERAERNTIICDNHVQPPKQARATVGLLTGTRPTQFFKNKLIKILLVSLQTGGGASNNLDKLDKFTASGLLRPFSRKEAFCAVYDSIVKNGVKIEKAMVEYKCVPDWKSKNFCCITFY